MTDEGAGFDPESIPDPTTPQNVVREGGRGLFLMRELLDDVQFNALGNSVTLILRVNPADRDLVDPGGGEDGCPGAMA